MLDQKMRALARDIEDGVEMPVLAGMVDRGAALRRRRRGAAVAVAASCLVAAGYLATLDRDPAAAPRPAIEPESGAAFYPGGPAVPDLVAGTYAIKLATDQFESTAEVTVPDGWAGWFGPARGFGRGYVGLLVEDVAYVAERPCQVSTEDMAAVGDAPADLVSALTRIPYHEVVTGPEPDSRFGVPATHLVLQATDRASCPGSALFSLWSAGGSLPAWSLGPGSRLELWVLDVDGEAVLVDATSTPRTPRQGLRELSEVVDSIEIVR